MSITSKVSIIIPSRGEIFLSKTIQDLLEKASGDIEIIAVLDGEWPVEQKRDYWTTPAIIENSSVHYLFHGEPRGMRASINHGIAVARGEYILKCDGHVMVDPGFDEVLKQNIEDNWIVIPRRKRLDAEKWEIQDVGKPDVDYEYLGSPAYNGAKGAIWNERIVERFGKPEYDIDENLSFQGSMWFTPKKYIESLGPLQEEGYGTFVREAQEIGLKAWLSGGKVMTNKKTWYAHLHKGRTYGRGYFLNKREMIEGEQYCDHFWFSNQYEKRIHDLAWLIERFSPVPTWSEELIDQVREK